MAKALSGEQPLVAASVSCAIAGEDLIIAAMEQEIPAARAALDAGASANYTNSFGIAPLHVSCGGTGPPEMLELLLAHGSDATKLDHTGWFPLLYAASSGQTKLVEVLLAAGGPAGAAVGLNATSEVPASASDGRTTTSEQELATGPSAIAPSVDTRPSRWTPLTRAAYRGNLDTVIVLLKAGADPDLPAGGGTAGPRPTASTLARAAGHHAVAEAIDEVAKQRVTTIGTNAETP